VTAVCAGISQRRQAFVAVSSHITHGRCIVSITDAKTSACIAFTCCIAAAVSAIAMSSYARLLQEGDHHQHQQLQHAAAGQSADDAAVLPSPWIQRPAAAPGCCAWLTVVILAALSAAVLVLGLKVLPGTV